MTNKLAFAVVALLVQSAAMLEAEERQFAVTKYAISSWPGDITGTFYIEQRTGCWHYEMFGKGSVPRWWSASFDGRRWSAAYYERRDDGLLSDVSVYDSYQKTFSRSNSPRIWLYAPAHTLARHCGSAESDVRDLMKILPEKWVYREGNRTFFDAAREGKEEEMGWSASGDFDSDGLLEHLKIDTAYMGLRSLAAPFKEVKFTREVSDTAGWELESRLDIDALKLNATRLTKP
jgi:hypothetical protein